MAWFTDFSILLIYLIAGGCAGLIGGLFGMGGGIILVPILYYLFSLQDFPPPILMHLVITTSLVTTIFTGLCSSWSHHKRQAIIWPIVASMVPGLFIGSAIGAGLANYLASDSLRIIFAWFELFVALQLGLGHNPSAQRGLPKPLGLGLCGGGIGAISTMLGIGGGTLTVPLLLWCNTKIRHAIAISAACGVPIAIVGSATMILLGLGEPTLPAKTWGYLYWPAALSIILASMLCAPIGARLAHDLPVKQLKKGLVLVLFLMGARMMLG